MDTDKELLTARELALRLRVSTDTIQIWTRSGTIPSLRFTRKAIRYDLAKVLAALAIQSKGGDHRGK